MKKKIITITAAVNIIDAISLLLVTMKPQHPVKQTLLLKNLKQPVSIYLN